VNNTHSGAVTLYSDSTLLHTFPIPITIRIVLKQTVNDYVPVDSESLTHKMLVLLMFRSLMVHIQAIIGSLALTMSRVINHITLICSHSTWTGKFFL